MFGFDSTVLALSAGTLRLAYVVSALSLGSLSSVPGVVVCCLCLLLSFLRMSCAGQRQTYVTGNISSRSEFTNCKPDQFVSKHVPLASHQAKHDNIN